MNPLQTLRIAVLALWRNRMRSFLTTLGIIIGVGAVIAMVAIGEGAKARVQQAFASMGTDLLVVMPGTTTSGGVHGGFGSLPTLTWDDVRAIEREVPTVRAVAPQLRTTAQLVGEDANWGTQLYGITPAYFQLRAWTVAEGSAFGQSEVDSGAKVVVLGETVASKLYGDSDAAIGQVVRIKGIPFDVIGVLAKKGQSAMGQDYDDAAFVPASTFQAKIQRSLGNFMSGVLYIGATSSETTARAQSAVRALLRDRHHLAAGADDDFSIRNLAEIASAQQESTNTLTTLLASIAAVSLLVGGIGIMNIMLVSVTERTREIGLRMAIGAKRQQILAQFLTEALALSSVGGILGVGLGLLAASQLAKRFGWSILVRPDVIFVAVAFSAGIGIAFGLYPARKAARLDPIEALRFE